MIRDTATMLAYEARRRPALAAIIATLPSLSIGEIDALPFMKWIRQALREERQRLVTIEILRQSRDSMEGHIVDGFVPDIEGHVRRWTGADTFVKLDRGEWLLLPNALVFLPMSGGVWIKTAFAHNIDPRLLTQTTELGLRTKSQYTAMYREEEARNAPVDAPVIAASPGAQGPLSQYGVQISRIN